MCMRNHMEETADKKRIIALVGLPGSGKGFFSQVAQDSGYGVVVMGDVIREYMQENKFPKTTDGLNEAMQEIRAKRGKNIVARLSAKRIRKMLEDNKFKGVIVDGVRSVEEVSYFKKNFWHIELISIVADEDVRYKRILKRKKIEDPESKEIQIRRENVERKVGLEDAMRLANQEIRNSGTIEEFEKKIKQLLNN